MNVTSGLTFNGTILLGPADGSYVGTLTAEGTQTLVRHRQYPVRR